jgi:PAS domain S-box-containing protein
VTVEESPAMLPAQGAGVAGMPDAALLGALVDCLADVTVFVFDRNLRYTHVVGAAVMSGGGWSADELVGRTAAELLPGDEGRALEQHQRAALAGETRRHEHHGIRAESAVWVSTLGPVRNSSGDIVAGLVVSRDVGTVRRTEAAKRRSDELFAIALQAAPVLVFSQDRDLRFTWANQTVLHHRLDDIIGRTDAEVLPPDAAAVTMPVKDAVLRTGERQRLLLEVPSDAGPRYFDMTVQPARGEDGEITGIVGAALDVTEIRTSEQRLRASLEAMLDSVTIQRPVRDESGEVIDFVIAYANATAVDFDGRDADELVGHTIRELYPGLAPGFIAGHAQVLRTGKPARYTAFPYVVTADATVLYDLAISRIGEELLVVWRDVTERERERGADARAEAIRDTSEQLQRGLLPLQPEQLDGFEVVATYHPATAAAEVGGDWYDVVPIEHGAATGQVDLVVGDVEGHDGEAAALMARLSSVIRADSRRGVELPALVRDLNAFHASLHRGRLASLAITRIDPSSGAASMLRAGHPPALVRRASGAVERVDVPVAPPIGVADGDVLLGELTLAPGDVLLMFSDGLLDPWSDPDDALDAVAAVVRDSDPARLASLVELISLRTQAFEPSDDVVVLGVRRLP